MGWSNFPLEVDQIPLGGKISAILPSAFYKLFCLQIHNKAYQGGGVVEYGGSASLPVAILAAILDCELNCRMTKDQDAQIVILRGKDAQIVIFAR